jgi:hypothetical protein
MMFRWIPASALIFLFALTAQVAPARADCVDDCERAYGGCSGPEQDQCLERVQECYRLECNKPTTSYGAIAYGAQSTANGFAFNEGTAGDADRSALANCRQHGDDCKIVASFSNSCAAVAAVESEGRFATGQAGTRDQAQANAMKACQAKGGGTCEIETWTCAFP